MQLKTKLNIIQMLIFLLLSSLVITYALNSYGCYYTLDGYVEGIYHLSSTQALIVKLCSFISFLSAFCLFIHAISRGLWQSKYSVLYYSMLIILLINIFVVTRNLFDFLTTPTMWCDRLSILPVLVSSVFFCAEQEEYWVYFKKAIKTILKIMIVVIAIILITKQGIYSDRIEAYKWVHGTGIFLRLCPFFLIVTADNRLERNIGVIGLVCYIISLIVLQTRLYVLDFAIMACMCILLVKNNRKMRKIAIILIIVAIGLISLLFLVEKDKVQLGNGLIASSLKLFATRLFEDTRTSQAKFFFSYFADSIPFGIGYNPEGTYSGTGTKGIDCGYLNTMYMAGIPMLLCWGSMTIVPIIKSLARNDGAVESIFIIARSFSWCVMLLSSTTTSFTIEFVFFMICAGRCSCILNRGIKECE